MTRPISSPLIDPLSRRQLPAYLLGQPGLARWHRQAACIGADAELFFVSGRDQQAQAEPALKICGTCPVRAQCREHAESAPEPYGIWGGTTPQDRGWDSWGKQRSTPSRGAPASADQAAASQSGSQVA